MCVKSAVLLRMFSGSGDVNLRCFFNVARLAQLPQPLSRNHRRQGVKVVAALPVKLSNPVPRIRWGLRRLPAKSTDPPWAPASFMNDA